MSNPKVKIPITLSRWRVEYKEAYGRWETQRHFPSRGAAVAYAQERRDKDPSTLTDWRVVDTQPDAEDEHDPIVSHSCADQARVSTFISPRFPDQIRNLWKGDPSEQSVRTALALAGDLIQELIDLRESMGDDQ